ncbi:MAG: sigma-70 family RNA polymerase sigma factor [Anaerolineae bacterium]|nr:sigma-70 family RNA polymerase sigma factor [Anaerolineae bacterium]
MTDPISTDDKLHRLIRRAQRGNEDAVAALYETYSDLIYRYVFYRVPTTTDAEDLTAAVFLIMIEKLRSYRVTGAPFEAWLYRIAAARIADFYRRARRWGSVELPEELRDGTPLPEEQIQQQQEIEMLQRALQELSDEHQTILFLRFRERKSHEEVARILGKTIGAVRNAQYRALSRLATLLGAEEKAHHYLRGEND